MVSAVVASSSELEEVVVIQVRQPVQVYQYTV